MSDESARRAAARFMLDADPDPGLLPRVMEPFAKRGLIPGRMWSHRGSAEMHVEVAIEDAPAEMLGPIEGNLRQIVGVRRLVVLRKSQLADAA
ncbi:MAG TPA: hypothetical protein VFA03_02965 [Acetobacteraceae bacterium]|nr:hypothetical protein [Acetobacteraceae bacterium]